MDKFVLRLDKAKKAIDEADHIIIGAGAGLSTAAGIEYTGERFERYFKDFIEEYGFTDMYSSGFYPFKTSEEKWAYWARHVFANRYDVGKTDVYQKLLKLVEDKDYFVLTTNVESQFWINGFEDGTFGVGKSITREQMATIFHRAILDVDGAPDVVNSSVSFVDYRQIGSWAADAVMNLAKAGLINGKGMGMFSPLSSASRAETASLVYKYLISR